MENVCRDFSNCVPFAVEPLLYCPHLEIIKNVLLDESKFNVKQPCKKCNDSTENWICLTCGEIYCSRFVNGHMATHFDQQRHPMTLSFSDISVWCYECEEYVHNPILSDTKAFTYNSKFGK